MIAGALAAGLLLAMGRLPWEAGLLTEVRAGSGGIRELEVDPQLLTGYEDRDLLLHLRYAPRLSLQWAPGRDRASSRVQAGSVDGWVRIDRDTHLAASGSISSGTTSLSWLASSPDTPPSSIATGVEAAPLSMLSARASLEVDRAITRRLQVGAGVRYDRTEGTGADRATLPRTETAGARAFAAWVGRRDALTLEGTGARSWFEEAQASWLAGLSASWRHALTAASERALRGAPQTRIGQTPEPRYETEVSGGATALSEAPAHRRLVPTASLAFRRDQPAPRFGAWSAQLAFRYAPTQDLATGELVPRYDASLDARLALHRTLFAFGSGAVEVAPRWRSQPGYRHEQGAGGLELSPNESFRVAVSGRVAKLTRVEWAGVLTIAVGARGGL